MNNKAKISEELKHRMLEKGYLTIGEIRGAGLASPSSLISRWRKEGVCITTFSTGEKWRNKILNQTHYVLDKEVEHDANEAATETLDEKNKFIQKIGFLKGVMEMLKSGMIQKQSLKSIDEITDLYEKAFERAKRLR